MQGLVKEGGDLGEDDVQQLAAMIKQAFTSVHQCEKARQDTMEP